MNVKQVGAQLYTVRDYLKTRSDIVKSLRKVKAMGYDAVQASALGPVSDDELVKILGDEGLICCATHENSEKLIKEPQPIIERLKKLKCGYVAYPYPHVKLETLDDVKSFASNLNNAGKVFHDAGIVLTYHNHHVEFRRFNGRLMLEVLYEETDPRYLQAEIDTYWVQYGGGNPVDWCRRLKGRLPHIHMKDYIITAENQPTYAEIGYGNLDWKAVIREAEKSGCEWFIVEQDTCSVDPFESLKMSFEYIKTNLCKTII